MSPSPFTFGINSTTGLLNGRSQVSTAALAIAITLGHGLAAPAAPSTPDRPGPINSSASSVLPSKASKPAIANDPDAGPMAPRDQNFTAAQLKYFLEIALGSEFSSTPARIHKWSGHVRIQHLGHPTEEDLKTLSTVIAEVNQLTQGEIHLSIVNETPNITIRFAPESQFSDYEPNYRPTNYGFFWTWWNNQVITRANILIATDRFITAQERSHLIREELTQSLGLMQDSWHYPDSLFYQDWTATTQYSAMDKALIRMLYQPTVKSGMTRDQAIAVLKPQSLGPQIPDWANKPPLKF